MALLQVIEGIVPIATAWIVKEIFDLLAVLLQSNSSIDFRRDFVPLLVSQAGINIFALALKQTNAYLNAEIGRKLQLETSSMLYKRITELDGLAYFEKPEFHDNMSLAVQGLHNGPSQVLYIFTNSIRDIITLLGFMSTFFFLSPLLVIMLIISSIPHLVAQLRISRQRFNMMSTNSPKERLANYFGMILSNNAFVKEIRVFGIGDYFLTKFVDVKSEVQSAQRKHQLCEVRWQFALGLLANFVSSIAFIFVIYQAVAGVITLGAITLYMSALGNIQTALLNLIYSASSMNENIMFLRTSTVS